MIQQDFLKIGKRGSVDKNRKLKRRLASTRAFEKTQYKALTVKYELDGQSILCLIDTGANERAGRANSVKPPFLRTPIAFLKSTDNILIKALGAEQMST